MKGMSKTIELVSDYVRKSAINLAKMSRETGIQYSALYDSLMHEERKRVLRDWEFLRICMFLDVDPRIFNEEKKEEKELQEV